MLEIDRARLADLEQVLDIAAERRMDYAEYQPQFWRPAPDAVHRQREYVETLLEDDQALVVVARDGAGLRGFAIGRLVPAPPVYDPGGASCVVDDFAVASPGEWSTLGPLLLHALRSWGIGRGAVQLVVVTAHSDQTKRAVLSGDGLTIASEWWVATMTDKPPLGQPPRRND